MKLIKIEVSDGDRALMVITYNEFFASQHRTWNSGFCYVNNIFPSKLNKTSIIAEEDDIVQTEISTNWFYEHEVLLDVQIA